MLHLPPQNSVGCTSNTLYPLLFLDRSLHQDKSFHCEMYNYELLIEFNGSCSIQSGFILFINHCQVLESETNNKSSLNTTINMLWPCVDCTSNVLYIYITFLKSGKKLKTINIYISLFPPPTVRMFACLFGYSGTLIYPLDKTKL